MKQVKIHKQIPKKILRKIRGKNIAEKTKEIREEISLFFQCDFFTYPQEVRIKK